MTDDCAEFYRQRDARTEAYTDTHWEPRLTIGVVIGAEAASSPVGQLLC